MAAGFVACRDNDQRFTVLFGEFHHLADGIIEVDHLGKRCTGIVFPACPVDLRVLIRRKNPSSRCGYSGTLIIFFGR